MFFQQVANHLPVILRFNMNNEIFWNFLWSLLKKLRIRAGIRKSELRIQIRGGPSIMDPADQKGCPNLLSSRYQVRYREYENYNKEFKKRIN